MQPFKAAISRRLYLLFVAFDESTLITSVALQSLPNKQVYLRTVLMLGLQYPGIATASNALRTDEKSKQDLTLVLQDAPPELVQSPAHRFSRE